MGGNQFHEAAKSLGVSHDRILDLPIESSRIPCADFVRIGNLADLKDNFGFSDSDVQNYLESNESSYPGGLLALPLPVRGPVEDSSIEASIKLKISQFEQLREKGLDSLVDAEQRRLQHMLRLTTSRIDLINPPPLNPIRVGGNVVQAQEGPQTALGGDNGPTLVPSPTQDEKTACKRFETVGKTATLYNAPTLEGVPVFKSSQKVRLVRKLVGVKQDGLSDAEVLPAGAPTWIPELDKLIGADLYVYRCDIDRQSPMNSSVTLLVSTEHLAALGCTNKKQGDIRLSVHPCCLELIDDSITVGDIVYIDELIATPNMSIPSYWTREDSPRILLDDRLRPSEISWYRTSAYQIVNVPLKVTAVNGNMCTVNVLFGENRVNNVSVPRSSLERVLLPDSNPKSACALHILNLINQRPGITAERFELGSVVRIDQQVLGAEDTVKVGTSSKCDSSFPFGVARNESDLIGIRCLLHGYVKNGEDEYATVYLLNNERFNRSGFKNVSVHALRLEPDQTGSRVHTFKKGDLVVLDTAVSQSQDPLFVNSWTSSMTPYLGKLFRVGKVEYPGRGIEVLCTDETLKPARFQVSPSSICLVERDGQEYPYDAKRILAPQSSLFATFWGITDTDKVVLESITSEVPDYLYTTSSLKGVDKNPIVERILLAAGLSPSRFTGNPYHGRTYNVTDNAQYSYAGATPVGMMVLFDSVPYDALEALSLPDTNRSRQIAWIACFRIQTGKGAIIPLDMTSIFDSVVMRDSIQARDFEEFSVHVGSPVEAAPEDIDVDE
ncbi:MAG TPA: hypothetical protein VFM18_07660 [Methanosarcina sp.]|nr:hypothetical protein [Methanosarcina sp.]